MDMKMKGVILISLAMAVTGAMLEDPDDVFPENIELIMDPTNENFMEAPKTSTLSAESSHLHSLVLHATSAIKSELVNMKKYPMAAAAVTPIQQMVQDLESAAADSKASKTCHAKETADASTCSSQITEVTCNGNNKCSWASDGGTADIAASLSTAKPIINNALTTMRNALVSDRNAAKIDLQTLDDAIDNSQRSITTSELESIKTKGSAWCTARTEKTQADQDAQDAISALATKLSVKLSDLSVANVKVSEIGALGEDACSKASGVLENGSCPASSCDLATRMTTALEQARKDYLDASWVKYNKDTIKTTKQNADNTAKGNFNTIVSTTASNYHAMCSNKDTVHGAAVQMFNDNNDHRSSMYRSLGVITCHINHMEIPSQSYTLPNDLLKSGGTAATTDADDCVSQLKTADELKTALFPAATANEDSDKACPTLQTYVNQIKAYGSLNFEENVWTPSEANCNSVASHIPSIPSVTCGITGAHVENPAYAQCSASSVDAGDAIGFRFGKGRLDSPLSWTAHSTSRGQWWQMDVGSVKQIAGVVTQGRVTHNQYVKTYQVKVSTDGITWADVDGGHVFTGNTATLAHIATHVKVYNQFASVVESRYVRIVVQAWNHYISMRSAVLVCSP